MSGWSWHLDARRATVCISPQIHVQWLQAGNLKSAMMGVFTPWKSKSLQIWAPPTIVSLLQESVAKHSSDTIAHRKRKKRQICLLILLHYNATVLSLVKILVYVLHRCGWKQVCFFYLPRRFASDENEKEKKTWAILLIRMLSSYSINLACPYAGETKRGGNVTVVTNVMFASWQLTTGTALGIYPCVYTDAFFSRPYIATSPI